MVAQRTCVCVFVCGACSVCVCDTPALCVCDTPALCVCCVLCVCVTHLLLHDRTAALRGKRREFRCGDSRARAAVSENCMQLQLRGVVRRRAKTEAVGLAHSCSCKGAARSKRFQRRFQNAFQSVPKLPKAFQKIPKSVPQIPRVRSVSSRVLLSAESMRVLITAV